jgi:hypothetical protein
LDSHLASKYASQRYDPMFAVGPREITSSSMLSSLYGSGQT